MFPDYDCLAVNGSSGVDWAAWLKHLHTPPLHGWLNHVAGFLHAVLPANAHGVLLHFEECSLGRLSADIMAYILGRIRGALDADDHGRLIQKGLAHHRLRVIAGSQWPVFEMLAREELRAVRVDGYDIANDAVLNCKHLTKPSLDWDAFQNALTAPMKKQADEWVVATRPYAFNWLMENSRDKLEAECPLGVLSAVAVRAFVCATTESSCYEVYADIIEDWIQHTPEALSLLAHSKWPIAFVLSNLRSAARHSFHLDFLEIELRGILPSHTFSSLNSLAEIGLWAGSLSRWGHSRSFRDVVAALPHLGEPLQGAPSLVYLTMVYGSHFVQYIQNFCARAHAVGIGKRLLLFTLDEDSFSHCLIANQQRCVRGSPSIVNKFTLQLICMHLGFDVMWIDFDVFVMLDPTPSLLAHAERSSYEILVSGSFESDCICTGMVYTKSTPRVRAWLLSLIAWIYNHPYDHDQKTFSAFLNHTETVSSKPLDLPEIPPWGILDPINEFVTANKFEGNGWMGRLEHIIIYHFLNGESDNVYLDDMPSFDTAERDAPGGTDTGSMALFYGQQDKELYHTAKAAHENPSIRSALLASRKASRVVKPPGTGCSANPLLIKGFTESASRYVDVDGYVLHKNSYLASYAEEDVKQRDIPEARVRCNELGSDCGGFTCDVGRLCTVRAGTTMKVSPGSGEITFLKSKSDNDPHLDTYLEGWAAGDSIRRGFVDSMDRCVGLEDQCGGITCVISSVCTVRASSLPLESPGDEVSYAKADGLHADG